MVYEETIHAHFYVEDFEESCTGISLALKQTLSPCALCHLQLHERLACNYVNLGHSFQVIVLPFKNTPNRGKTYK